MRLLATEYLSIDGVFEEPGQWSLPFFSADVAQFKWRELQQADALLLGRRTYEGFAAAWPTMDAGEFGEKMNTMPKYVVSSTLDSLEWSGAELLRGDVSEAVAALKEQPGNDLLLSGSRQLFQRLHQDGLIDVYRFMLHPIVLGGGARLFSDDFARTALKRIGHELFEAGIVILDYEPAAES